jgi:hypothetical protein
MTCHQVQTDLSLYLYGELDFAAEEQLEEHLETCALCQNALAREKSWHTAVKSEQLDAPIDLLSECRRDLKSAVSHSTGSHKSHFSWGNWMKPFRLSATRWSMGMAVGSFLVFMGFSAGRLADRNGMTANINSSGIEQAGVLNPSTGRIRDIQADDPQHVRIIVDGIRQEEITGSADDKEVRQWLLVAMKDPSDPGLRVDSVEALQSQDGSDVRDALLYSVRHDSNAAVRVKALQGLRRFTSDAATREALRFVLEHDSNPGVRSEAIDVLARADQKIALSPDLTGTLQEIARSQDSDDYVRMRCLEVLARMKTSADVY